MHKFRRIDYLYFSNKISNFEYIKNYYNINGYDYFKFDENTMLNNILQGYFRVIKNYIVIKIIENNIYLLILDKSTIDIDYLYSKYNTIYYHIINDKNFEKFNKKQQDLNNINTNKIHYIDNVDIFLDELFSNVFKRDITDIHIEPKLNNAIIYYRLNGKLNKYKEITKESYYKVIRKIKLLSNITSSNKKLPKDAQMQYTIGNEKLNIRVASIHTVNGEKLALRIFSSSIKIPDIGCLEFNSDLFKVIDTLNKSKGFILICGPTGSGKTTTLYSFLKYLNIVENNILTIEDPVEYKLDGLNQIELNKKAELTFDNIIKGVLRQDPDIIGIGEIRDLETMETAIKAAITGHLVLSTFHISKKELLFERLSQMGVNKEMTENIFNLVIIQKLVRILCNNCKIKYLLSKSEQKYIGINNKYVYKENKLGCEFCFEGISKRKAIYEVVSKTKSITIKDKMQNLLIKGELSYEEYLSFDFD